VGAAAWVLELEQEVVWVGDGGEPEFSGETRRWGLDLEARTALLPWLFADVDFNFADGKATGDDVEEGADKIPLAPNFTSTGGFTVDHPQGWFGTLRYRYVDERPANETGSVRAEGHTLLDASAGKRFGPWSLEVIGENLTDEAWNEAQFDTESRIRLPDGTLEAEPVSELHFTPGNPLNVRVRAGVQF
jgi:outer membrane receptor protein involved in Fe transport